MIKMPRSSAFCRHFCLTGAFFATLALTGRPAQPERPAEGADEATVIRGIDQAVYRRLDEVVGYTATEDYAVYRGEDARPAAAMKVRTTYRKESGKSYEILAESGSELIRRFGLHPLLDSERTINQPANREHALFVSANYNMRLKPGAVQRVNGRDCFAIAISPHARATNLIEGTLWVDATDYTIVRLEGVSTKSASLVSSPPHVTRDYIKVDGYSQASHATAISSGFLFGRVRVTIDYSDYHLQLKAPN